MPVLSGMLTFAGGRPIPPHDQDGKFSMTTFKRIAPAAIAIAMAQGWVTPAQAQDAGDFAAMRAEMTAMRQAMDAMANRIDTLEGELAVAKAKADAAASSADAATSVADAARTASSAAPRVNWKGGPEFSAEGGWSFKPRGRLQIDAGAVSAPDGIEDRSMGFGSEIRRAYLGVDGTLPGGFAYRVEADFANSEVELTDLYLTYQASRKLALTVGLHKPFWGLEEMTSDLFTSFTERAAINTAFGYERRVGASAAYATGAILAQAGIFTDNAADLGNDENNSIGYDGRLVFMPKLGGGQLHLGGSFHHRELNNAGTLVRYRVRPFIHTPDIRFADTGTVSAASETGYGLEAAWLKGPLHVTGEAHWQNVGRAGLPNPTFFGGYAEVGYFLTRGDGRAYKGGAFDRTRPAHGADKGGIGAVELNLRYDYLDLVDAGIVGGRQNGYAVSLVWSPTAYTRFIANYGHVDYDMAAIAAGVDRSFGVDAFGMRAQFDF